MVMRFDSLKRRAHLSIRHAKISVRWTRQFEGPITLSDGRMLRTLRDASDYITKLPKAVHSAEEWQAAMEDLILVADLGGPHQRVRKSADFDF